MLNKLLTVLIALCIGSVFLFGFGLMFYLLVVISGG